MPLSATRRRRDGEHGRRALARVACIAGIASIAWLPSTVLAQSSGARRAPVVDSVVVVRENVFDRDEGGGWLKRSANGLHVVTRERIVTRELLVRPGAPYDSSDAAESARNLRRLGIFRDVAVDTVREDGKLVARVTTSDSWTTQLNASFKAGGDQITWGVGATEKNFLGTGIRASVRYSEDPDRSTTRFGVAVPRMWRERYDLAVSYDELSDGKRGRLLAQAPFTSLTTRHSFAFDVQYNDGDVLRFYEGELDARDTLRHLMTKGIVTAGFAPRAADEGFVRLLGSLQVRREDFTQDTVAQDDRSFFAELEFAAEASRANFAVVRGYRSLAGPEDIDLSRTLRVGVWLASSSFGYDRTGLGPAITAQAGRTFEGGFTLFRLRASSLFTRHGLDSGQVAITGMALYQPRPGHAIVVGANAGMQKDARPGAEYDLGLSFGPRGFPLHGFTGDRAFFTSGEYRLIAIPDLWGLAAIGLAGFVDYGGAWYAGSDVRTGVDAGIGIRLGSIRSSSGKPVTRIDFTRRFANDVMPGEWVVAVGAGFPFERGK
jgi:hypothetical protein